MKKFLRYGTFLVLLTLSLGVYAQERTVSGKVTSVEDNSPLPGVSVVLKGTTIGTATDVNGSYTLQVPTDAVLVFSFIGMKTLEISVGQRSQVDAALEMDVTQLGEVVITTFGEAKKSSFTGSYSQLTAENLSARPLSNAITAIAGSTAGVTTTSGIGQPGAAPDIRIRGIGSYSSSNSPLYVVDGVPYTASIANLNSADIETLTILKDAASTALYGARAANGVVMITTKKGKDKNGSINVRYTKGFSERGMPEYEKVGAAEYYPLMWQMLRNNLAYTTTGTGVNQDLATAGGNATNTLGTNIGYNVYDVPFNQLVDANGVMNPNARLLYSQSDLDWEAPLMRQGNRDELSVNFSGANDKSDYFVSFGYLDDQGYQIRSDYKRYNARVNYNSQIKKWLKTGVICRLPSPIQGSQLLTGVLHLLTRSFSRAVWALFSLYMHMTQQIRDHFCCVMVRSSMTTRNMSALGLPNRPQYGGRHAIAETELNEAFFRRNVLGARGYIDISFLKDFKFTLNAGADITNQNDVSYGNPLVGDGSPAGRTTHRFDNISNFNLNQLLNYSKSFGSHNCFGTCWP
jgi:TonB-linked SusC/RagA family outer membrane protein